MKLILSENDTRHLPFWGSLFISGSVLILLSQIYLSKLKQPLLTTKIEDEYILECGIILSGSTETEQKSTPTLPPSHPASTLITDRDQDSPETIFKAWKAYHGPELSNSGETGNMDGFGKPSPFSKSGSMLETRNQDAFLPHRILKAQARLISQDAVQEEGIVVVKIVVNPDGEVTRAEVIPKGSTTLNSSLWFQARNAALTAKFDKCPGAPDQEEGRYIFHFTFK